MRMARVNVYLPDDLARAARDAELNVSQITRRALAEALEAGEVDRWLDGLSTLPASVVDHAAAMAALDAAREELGR